MVQDTCEARVDAGPVPARRLRTGLRPPGAQRVDEVHVQQAVQDRLLAGLVAGDRRGEKVDRRSVSRLDSRGLDHDDSGQGAQQRVADAALQRVGSAQNHRFGIALVGATAPGLRDRLRVRAELAGEAVRRARGNQRDVSGV